MDVHQASPANLVLVRLETSRAVLDVAAAFQAVRHPTDPRSATTQHVAPSVLVFPATAAARCTGGLTTRTSCLRLLPAQRAPQKGDRVRRVPADAAFDINLPRHWQNPGALTVRWFGLRGAPEVKPRFTTNATLRARAGGHDYDSTRVSPTLRCPLQTLRSSPSSS